MIRLAKDLEKEISNVTTTLVGVSLCDEQNMPSQKTNKKTGIVEIGVAGNVSFSAAMKNIAYKDAYNEIESTGSYNIKLIDGALLQLLYRTTIDNRLISHRLSFYSSPSHETYQNEPEIYEIDSIYSDFTKKNIVPFPIRFDFNSDEDLHVDGEHPKSHMTLGQYKGCRIPVTAPVGPATFVKFILKNFYTSAYAKKPELQTMSSLGFDRSITQNETWLSHFNVGKVTESFIKRTH